MREFKEKPTTPHYHGHRTRLRQRFIENGANTLNEYEILELILFRAIPRKDTKPLAKSLLNKFGNFAEVINAPDIRLKEVDGVGDAVVGEIKLIGAAALLLMQSGLVKKEVLSSWKSLIQYCKASMAYQQREQFRIIFLDKNNQILSDEVQSEGTIDHTPVYVREVLKRALDTGASAIILVHNHPSGDPVPSNADIKMTKQLIDALQKVSILVHDHIIVGREGHASMGELNLI